MADVKKEVKKVEVSKADNTLKTVEHSTFAEKATTVRGINEGKKRRFQ